MPNFDKNDPTLFFAHHIGGRAGSVSFPDLPKFSADIAHVIYDADDSCLAQIEDIWSGKNVTVLPYCLADKCGPQKFHINYCPYTSSLFPMNTNFENFYHKNGKYDYVYKFALKTEKTINVETRTLDSLVATGIISPPDFLSIDTQGAELLILHGAKQCLNKNTVAVLVEINFTTLYEGAPLFGELDEFLRSNKFMLAEITPTNIGYKRIPEAIRGKGIPLQGEALYLLQPDAVKGLDEIECSRKLGKLAFAACTFGFTEIAFEALERSVSIAQSVPKLRMYQKFLHELFEEMGKHSQIPPLWHEMYSFEESNQRFSVVKKRTLKSALLEKGAKWVLLKVMSKIQIKVMSSIQKVFSLFRIKISVLPKRTSFYSFLIKNGFHLAAQRIIERRQSGL